MSLGNDRDYLYERRLREQAPMQKHFRGDDVIKKLNDSIKPVEQSPNNNPLTYAMDFDGVLHQHETGDGAGALTEPLEPGMRLAKRIKAAGHKLVILTARPEEQHDTIHGWLKGHGVKADEVTNKKPPAEMYIDDRAHRWPRNAGGKSKKIDHFGESSFLEHGVQGQKWHHHKEKNDNPLGLEKRKVNTQEDSLKLVKEALEKTSLKRLMYKGSFDQKTNMRLALYQAAGLTADDYDKFNSKVGSWVGGGGGKNHPIRVAAEEIANGDVKSSLARALLLENAINRMYFGERSTVKLYRSMDGKLASELQKAKKDGKDYISVEFNHADHWSTDFSASREFGSAQFRKIFPSKDILLCYKTNSKFDTWHEEKEHVPLVRGKELTFAIRNKKQNDDGAWAQHFGGSDDD